MVPVKSSYCCSQPEEPGNSSKTEAGERERLQRSGHPWKMPIFSTMTLAFPHNAHEKVKGSDWRATGVRGGTWEASGAFKAFPIRRCDCRKRDNFWKAQQTLDAVPKWPREYTRLLVRNLEN